MLKNPDVDLPADLLHALEGVCVPTATHHLVQRGFHNTFLIGRQNHKILRLLWCILFSLKVKFLKILSRQDGQIFCLTLGNMSSCLHVDRRNSFIKRTLGNLP